MYLNQRSVKYISNTGSRELHCGSCCFYVNERRRYRNTISEWKTTSPRFHQKESI